MDAYEATRVVFSRVQSLDPDNAAKIMGSLLLQDNGDKNMIRLAFSPDSLLHSLVLKARNDLALVPPSPQPPYFLNRQASSPRLVSPSSWAPPPPFSRSASINGREDLLQPGDELFTPAAPFFGGGDLADELMGPKGGDLLYQDLAGECRSPGAVGDAVPYPYWGHRRSFSDSSDAAAAGWRPCLYYAKGYCKNGSSCRFDHAPPADADATVEQQCQELLLRSRSQRLMPSSYPYSPAGSPSSPSAKCINFLLQQQSDNQQRAAAAAALMLGGGGGADARSFIGRARMERGDFEGMLNPGSRQIYLTFPADSTFREEDVSNYFSIYGPVQDVRIPYQQKRMFGFVTFVYSDTVKIILAKGNPHFVCDARVLVKPYKEKGKVPEKFRNKPLQQQAERGDLSGFDGSDPFDLQQLGARMLYNGVNQEALMRRKLEQQQHAAELQQAIEMQSRRFAGLQLLDLEAAARNRAAFYPSNNNNGVGLEQLQSQSLSLSPEDKSPSPAALLSSSSGSGGSGVAHLTSLRQLSVNVEAAADPAADKEKSAADSPREEDSSAFQQSLELNLPDSPFASPTRAFSTSSSATSPHSDSSSSNSNNHQPSISAPFKSCFHEIPRLSSSVGL